MQTFSSWTIIILIFFITNCYIKIIKAHFILYQVNRTKIKHLNKTYQQNDLSTAYVVQERIFERAHMQTHTIAPSY